MKKYSITALSVAALLSFSVVGFSQYDDVYYSPGSKRDNASSSRDYAYEDGYQNTYQEYDDEVYDYYYTSRIRRFHRPLWGFSYFDPYFTDLYYYDPFLSPGVTVLIYDSPWYYGGWGYWSPWRYYRPYYPYYYGYNPWGYYSPYYYAHGGPAGWSFSFSFSFGSPWWGWGIGYASPYYYGGYYGYTGGFYCPPTWGGGYDYYTANTYAPNAVTNSYGPRTQTGMTTAPRTNASRPDTRQTAPAGNAVAPRSNGAASPADDASARPRPPQDRYSRPAPRVYQPAYEWDNREEAERPQAVTPRSPAYAPARTSPNRADEQRATSSRTYTPERTETRTIERSTPGNRGYAPRQPANPAPRYAPSPQRSGNESSINRQAPSRNNAPANSGSINRPMPGRSAAPAPSGGGAPQRAARGRSSGGSR